MVILNNINIVLKNVLKKSSGTRTRTTDLQQEPSWFRRGFFTNSLRPVARLGHLQERTSGSRNGVPQS